MAMRITLLSVAAALILPLPAQANCAERIAAVESHPAMIGGQNSSEASGETSGVRVDGGESTHAEGGPATPSESWFTDSENEDRASVLTHLDNAKQAQNAGDERACIDAVEQAEAALKVE